MHVGERIQKVADSYAGFTGYVWTLAVYVKKLQSCGLKNIRIRVDGTSVVSTHHVNKQLLDVVEHDIMNYQNRGLCYLPKPKAEADNTDKRF